MAIDVAVAADPWRSRPSKSVGAPNTTLSVDRAVLGARRRLPLATRSFPYPLKWVSHPKHDQRRAGEHPSSSPSPPSSSLLFGYKKRVTCAGIVVVGALVVRVSVSRSSHMSVDVAVWVLVWVWRGEWGGSRSCSATRHVYATFPMMWRLVRASAENRGGVDGVGAGRHCQGSMSHLCDAQAAARTNNQSRVRGTGERGV